MKAVRGTALLALCWLFACAPQSDLVALRNSQTLCTQAAGCLACSVTNTCPAPDCTKTNTCPQPPDCTKTNTCPPTDSDAGCAATGTCGPGDGGAVCTASEACVECAAATSCMQDPNARCEDRACAPASDRGTICLRTGPVLTIGDGCDSARANPRFRFTLCSKTTLVTTGPLNVVGDVGVDGLSANFGAATEIDGALRYAGDNPPIYLDDKPVAVNTVHTAPNCGVAQSKLLDITATVKARATDNDNSVAGLAITGLDAIKDERLVTLPCGRYYLGPIQGVGSLTIRTVGQVALFIDGSVSLDGGLHIESNVGARITVVVNGAFHVKGGFTMGSYSALRNLLVVSGQVHIDSGASELGGIIYTPDELLSTGMLVLRGSAFVGSARLNGTTVMEYTPAAALAAFSCDYAGDSGSGP